MGRPNRFTRSNTIAFDIGKDKDGDDTVAPTVRRDVEASGGLQADTTRKTGADLPPMI